ESERVVLEAARDGLPAVVFRPACVYGPFSRIFITRPMEALAEGRFRLIGEADAPSNTVYVDNLVEAVARALEAPEGAVKGEVFTVSEPDQVSWREFYEYFANALSYTIPTVAKGDGPDRGAARGGRGALGWLASWGRGVKSVVTSAEFRALGKRVLQTDPLGTLPRWALQRYPGLRRRVRSLVKASDGAPVYRRPAATAPNADDVVEMGLSRYFVSSEKARRVLGYTPVVSRQRAMELTLEWVRYARLTSR
ncbi:MAG: NAD-dependent epimerase/dehydratase family protein, partial [Gemmataceae bacterium]